MQILVRHRVPVAEHLYVLVAYHSLYSEIVTFYITAHIILMIIIILLHIGSN